MSVRPIAVCPLLLLRASLGGSEWRRGVVVSEAVDESGVQVCLVDAGSGVHHRPSGFYRP